MYENNNLKVDFIDLTDLDAVRKSIKPETVLIWIETPTNPTLKVCDIKSLCNLCKEH
jgi:cystathionine beta-lyase/cystathionine gamma-synthase